MNNQRAILCCLCLFLTPVTVGAQIASDVTQSPIVNLENKERDLVRRELEAALRTKNFAKARKMLNTVVTGADLHASAQVLLRQVDDLRIVRFLQENGAHLDINANYWWDKPVFVEACMWKDSGTKQVAMLLKAGADINIQTKGAGFTALMYAARAGNVKVARFLIEKGAFVAIRNNNGDTALHEAVTDGNEAMIRLLLDKGADINARNNQNSTPLHRAVETGRVGTVRLLLKRGAKVNTPDNMGNTPLWIAYHNKVKEIARLLQEAGAHE